MSNDITTRFRDTHDRDLSPVTPEDRPSTIFDSIVGTLESKTIARQEEDCSKTRGSVSLRHPFGVSSVEQTPSPLLRYVACVILMMVVGVSGVKADDFSGTYYIASNAPNNNRNYKGYDNADNFYLCAAQEYYDNGTINTTTPNETPFLTTYQTKQTDESLWIVEKVEGTNYYTFKQKYGTSFRYLTVNDPISSLGDSKKHRRRVHLEEITNISDRNYFTFTYITTIDDINGYAIGCIDKYKSGSNQYLNPPSGNYPKYTAGNDDSGGIIGFYNIDAATTGNGRGSVWFFEVPKPIIHIDNNNKLTFTCANEDVTFHYTIDGGDPSATGTNDVYNATDDITLTEGVHTIKAIAVMNSDNVGYASGVATYVVRILNTTSSYLIQNVECTDYYMIPGDVNSGNTEVNTSSLFRSTMAWNFSYAGSENGFLYYYIKNGASYLYHTSDGKVYMKTSSDFSDSDDGYKFFIVQGYNTDSNPDGFHIVPKAKSSDNTYSIYKGGWSGATTIANSKVDAMKGSTNARRPEQKHTRWNFIEAPDNKLPASLTYDSNDSNDANWPAFLSSSTATKYFKIENVGTAGRYICPPTGEAAVGTATTGDNELAWYVIEAGHDDWQKYYYIVHASTGKYLKFNQEISSPPSSMAGKNSVLSLLDFDSSTSDRYQFVFAKSTIDGAYYIVPKGLEDATYNSYYALYLDATSASTLEQPIKSTKNRASDSYKWKFVTADLFCNNPVFEEKTVGEGKEIIISCTTNAAKIYYTADGTEPSEDPSKLYNTNTSWTASEQHLIKAIAVVSNGADSSTSQTVTLLNKPDIALKNGEVVIDADTYTYDGTAKTPTPSKVYIGTTETTTGFAVASIDPYLNNTDAGTATVYVADNNATDNWYILNASTTFTINPKGITVTAAAGQTKVYGDADPTLTATIAGRVSEEDAISYTVSRAEGELVGDYTITPSGEALQGNYSVSYISAPFTITPKALTITADSDTKEYDGEPLTKNSFTSSGLVEGDEIISVTITGSQTDIGSSANVASAAVIKKGGTDVTTCYTITYEDGTLTVTKQILTITAGSNTKVYDGTALTKDSYTSTGLMVGDNVTSVTITGSQTVVGTGNNVPSDAIVKNGNNEDVTLNYEIHYVNGTLTVTQKALTITADNETKVYDGTALTKNTYTNTDLAAGDNIESVTVTGSQTDVGTSDNVPSAAVIKNGSNEDVTSSYTITYNNGTLEVTAKAVTITANDASRPYDGTALTEAGFTTTDLGISDQHIFTVTMTTESTITNAGTQPNVIATVDGVAVTTGTETAVGNYLVTTANGTLTISGKPIGNGALATGFTIEFGENNAITVKDGETTLTLDTDYTIDDNTTTSASGRYSLRAIRGTGNYGGIAYIRNAIVNFQTDANEGEWSATFVAENADPNAAADNAKGHALPTDGSIKAYIITKIEGNWAIPEELNYIPEGVPVLLLSTKESNGFPVKDASGHTLITTGAGEQVEKNMLEVRNTIWEDVPARTIYLLYKNEFTYNMAGNLAAGKVYLNPKHTVPAPSPAPSRLWILWDTATQINGITEGENTETENNVWYSLDGQKLSKKPTHKGFYIKNGKKVIVK